MAQLSNEDIKKITDQAISEIAFARRYKQGKTRNWQKNEDLYYGKKQASDPDVARANVDLNQMQSFVHTLLSKIDNPLVFKYLKRKESQLKRVERLNALRELDATRGDWDIKDIVGKKQALIYGRAVYSYYAESIDGYQSHLDNVDVYDFLIDPSAGGIDIEQARFLGDYGVVLSKQDMEAGIKNGTYLKDNTEKLIQGSGNSQAIQQETTNKNSRAYGNGAADPQKEIGDLDKFKFWRWGTTFNGKRYYLLLSEEGATSIRVEELKDMFDSELWWYWTWACFPDLTEFWTPSYCDYVREVFMAQAVSINQMLDNAEQINKPQRVVNVTAVTNLEELKYRRNSWIKVKGDMDANRAVQNLAPSSIDTPLKVYDILESIQEKSSGVTAGAKGVADASGKATIYQGNEANVADRFGFLNKSYAFGYKRFAKLYEHGVREHLNKRTAIDILGPEGVNVEMVSRKDIFRKADTFGVIVEAANAELDLSEKDKGAKLTFLAAQINNPGVNPQKLFEMQASIVGFSAEEIRQLQDTTDFGDASIMAEAERDIEALLDGQKIKPNQGANTAYKQRFVDYMLDNASDLDMDDFTMLSNYILLLDPVIIRNMTRAANQKILLQRIQAMGAAGANPADPANPTPIQPQTTEQSFNSNVNPNTSLTQ